MGPRGAALRGPWRFHRALFFAMSRLLLCLLAALPLAACTSPSGSGSGASGSGDPDAPPFIGPPTRITWTLYKTGQQITLLNETHTDRLEYYSAKRDTASAKIQEDELVAALVGFFDEEGFEKYAKPGNAPAEAIGRASQSLEVEVDGRTRFMVWGPDEPKSERKCFVQCRDGLTEIWNATYAAQAVQNERGGAVFGTSTSKKR